MTPSGAIREFYGGDPNFMTPSVIRCGWVIPGRMAYELSEGTGFSGQPIYGVTFVTVGPRGRCGRVAWGDGHNRCFTEANGKSMASSYIRQLTERGGQFDV